MTGGLSAFIARIPGLTQDAAGIWRIPAGGPVSYPADVHTAYRDVEDRSFWFRHRNRCILTAVRRQAQPGPFLDLGGGRGFVSRFLAQSGYPCIMIEPSPDGALAARQRGVDSVICARIEDLALPPGAAGNCGLFDVLEHIADDAAMLRRIHECLAPDGRLFLNVPTYQFLFSPDDQHAGHYRRYTRRTLTQLLTASGFDVLYATYLFAPLVVPVFLLRTVPGHLGLLRHRAGQIEADHAPGGLAGRAIEWLLGHEGDRIAAGGAVPFGTSCLCVAARR